MFHTELIYSSKKFDFLVWDYGNAIKKYFKSFYTSLDAYIVFLA